MLTLVAMERQSGQNWAKILNIGKMILILKD